MGPAGSSLHLGVGEHEKSAEDWFAGTTGLGVEAQQGRHVAQHLVRTVPKQTPKLVPSHRDGDTAVPRDLDPRVVEVYRGVGQLLRRYTVGRLPKAFKIIPNLRNWEEAR